MINLSKKEKIVCEEKQGCEKPESLRGTPQECSQEQIRKCHGDDKERPCVESDADKKSAPSTPKGTNQ